MWPQRFCLPVTHDGMEGQKDQMEPVVKHIMGVGAKQNSVEGFQMCTIYMFRLECCRHDSHCIEQEGVIPLAPSGRLEAVFICSNLIPLKRILVSYYWLCHTKTQTQCWSFWELAGSAALYDILYCFQSACSEGVCGMVRATEGEGSYMNHSLLAGNKVHFLSRQTISQPLQDMAGPPDINLHGGVLLLPRGGWAEWGECFNLNGSIYHTCSSILKDRHVRGRRGEEGEMPLTCVACQYGVRLELWHR